MKARDTLSRMDAERARAFLLSLPLVTETLQWGENLVFWIADKGQGGKMFALVDLSSKAGTVGPVMSFAATREHQAELLEREGLVPAPYLARAGWVAAGRWDALERREWMAELQAANEVVWAKLPANVRERLRPGVELAQPSAAAPESEAARDRTKRAQAGPSGSRQSKRAAAG